MFDPFTLLFATSFAVVFIFAIGLGLGFCIGNAAKKQDAPKYDKPDLG